MMQMLTRNYTMHCHSRAFTKGYVSVPKYTPHSESSRGKLLGLSPQGSLSLLNSPHTSLYFSSLFIFLFLLPFHALFTVLIISSHNYDANECHEVNHPHSQVSTILHKFLANPNIIKITIIPQFQSFPIIPIISILKYNYFPQ